MDDNSIEIKYITNFQEALREAKELEAVLKKLPDSLNKDKSSNNAVSGFKNIAKAARNLESGLQPLYTSLRNVTLGIGGLATALVGQGFGVYKQIEQTTIGFRALTGSAKLAKEIMDDIRKTTTGTPIRFADLAEAIQQLTVYTKDATKAKDVATDFAKLVLQSGRNISEELPNIIRNLGDIATGAFTQIDFNQLRRQIPLVAQGLEKLGITSAGILKKVAAETGQSAFDIVAMAAKGAVNPEILDYYKNTFSGLFISITGIIRNSIADIIGETGLDKVLKEGLGGLRDDLPTFLERFRTSITPFVEWLKTLDLKDIIEQSIGGAFALFETLAVSLQTTYNIVKPILTGFLILFQNKRNGETLAETAGKLAGGLLTFIIALKGFNVVTGIIGAITPGLTKLFSLFGFGKKIGKGKELADAVSTSNTLKNNFAKLAKNFLAIGGSILLLKLAANTLKDIDTSVPIISVDFALKLASIGTALIAMGALVKLAGTVFANIPSTLIGVGSILGIAIAIGQLAQAIGDIDTKVPEISLSFSKKMGNMILALTEIGIFVGALGLLITGTGGIAGLIGAAGIAALGGLVITIHLLKDVADALNELAIVDVSKFNKTKDIVAAINDVIKEIPNITIKSGLKTNELVLQLYDLVSVANALASLERVWSYNKIDGTYVETIIDSIKKVSSSLTNWIIPPSILNTNKLVLQFYDLVRIANTLGELGNIQFNYDDLIYRIDVIKDVMNRLSTIEPEQVGIGIANIVASLNSMIELLKTFDGLFLAQGTAYAANLEAGWRSFDAENKILAHIQALVLNLAKFNQNFYDAGNVYGNRLKDGFIAGISGMADILRSQIANIQVALNNLSVPNLAVNVSTNTTPLTARINGIDLVGITNQLSNNILGISRNNGSSYVNNVKNSNANITQNVYTNNSDFIPNRRLKNLMGGV